MKKNKIFVFGILLLSLFAIIVQGNFTSAATSTTTVCAEHTTYRAWCQDVPMSQVDTSYPYSAGTACASTTYCATGTCANTVTGTCLASPQATCSSSQGGQWYSTNPQNTPICQLGCCQFGEQASFTTKVACTSLSSLYGQNATFNSHINNEPDCLATAFPQAKGACIYDSGNGRTCTFTTRQQCNSMTNAKTTFYGNFLCTNPSLNTNCVPTQKTTCLSTADQVYFVDSCGNPANVYDSNKVSDTNYWSYVAGTNGVTVDVGDGKGNIESTTNGNCNYYLGSTCMPYNASIDGSHVPVYGNNICRNINCFSTSDPFVQSFQSQYGRTPVNGESWCGLETATGVQLEPNGNPGINISGGSGSILSGTGLLGVGTTNPSVISTNKNGNIPGGTEVLFICQNGQVTYNVNANYRNQICLQNETSNGYYSANLVANRWQDCYYQNNSKDCLNENVRDCLWVIGASVLKDSNGIPYVYDLSQNSLVPQTSSNQGLPGAACVPKYSPGFNSTDPGSQTICGLASFACYMNFTKNGWQQTFGGQSPAGSTGGNCLNSDETLNTTWANGVSNFGIAMGDCGIGTNYIGTNGANGLTDLFSVITNRSYS